MRRDVLLPITKSAPMLARQALNDAIPPPELRGRIEDARLAITELVSNAVLHGRLRPDADTIRLVIAADDDVVKAEVEQSTSTLDARVVEPRLGQERSGGFGLRLVDATADDWGVEPGPPGSVWFEFRR